MKSLAPIQFRDAGDAGEVGIFVRYDDRNVAIGISIRSNGDYDILMPKAIAEELVRALTTAVEQQ